MQGSKSQSSYLVVSPGLCSILICCVDGLVLRVCQQACCQSDWNPKGQIELQPGKNISIKRNQVPEVSFNRFPAYLYHNVVEFTRK